MIEAILKEIGPSKSSSIVEKLVAVGLTADSARKRISRVRPPICRFPVGLFPKGESFVYLRGDEKTERFWAALLRDLRLSNSAYSAAVDCLVARGGVVPRSQFGIVSSGSVAPKKNTLSSQAILHGLKKAHIVADNVSGFPNCIYISQVYLAHVDPGQLVWKPKLESLILDAVRQWAKNLGLASYNSITIRDEPNWKPVGPFDFDIAGPSYLMPLSHGKAQPGFFVADVFVEGVLDQYQIRSFIRKAKGLKAILSSGIMPVLVAPGFTGDALRAGHEAGVAMASLKTIFGKDASEGLHTLLNILSNAAAYVSNNPDGLAELLGKLTSIEGTAGNLRGILFELIAGSLARRSAVSIDIGIKATNRKTGQTADIDVLKVTEQSSSVTCIECKGKEPGGRVTLQEVDRWFGKLPTFLEHIRSHHSLREASVAFEFWTTGTFDDDALAALQKEKDTRVKTTISWLDGPAVLKMAKDLKMKSISSALETHYLSHPLMKISVVQP